MSIVERGSVEAPCPCGSGLAFGDCCGPLVGGERGADSPEALMRSRYVAFCLHDENYLLRTWHPRTRPAGVEFEEQLRWIGLRIIESAAGEADGGEAFVEFAARYKVAGRAGRLHERSRFLREDGCWFYLDGDMQAPSASAPGTARNVSCPCGSGRKYKHCCGR